MATSLCLEYNRTTNKTSVRFGRGLFWRGTINLFHSKGGLFDEREEYLQEGTVHLLDKGYPIFSDEVGYTVTDNSLNVNVWGSYNGLMDHLWSLEDVEEFLKSEYSKRELIF